MEQPTPPRAAIILSTAMLARVLRIWLLDSCADTVDNSLAPCLVFDLFC